MAQSATRKIKRGHLRTVFNKTFNRVDIFKRVSNGRWIASTVTGQVIGSGPGYTTRQLDKMAEA